MRKPASLTLAVLLLCSAIPSFAAEPPAFIRGIRPLGMGGAFIAIADDQNAVFYNPAGLTQRRGGHTTILELPVNFSDDIFNFYSYYRDNHDDLENFGDSSVSLERRQEILDDINNIVSSYRPRVRTGLPNAGYLSGPGFLSWGAGLYSQADIGFQFNRSLIIPSIDFWGTVDIVGATPLAHRFDRLPYIPGKLSAGATLKYIRRARIAEYGMSILEFENFEPTLQWGSGFGVDLGALYQPDEAWNVGLQISDFGGTPIRFERVDSSDPGEVKEETTDVIHPRVNVGAAYVPSRITYWPGRAVNTRNRLTLALDVQDAFNSEEPLFEATFWKKLHLGAEFKWSVFALRGGLNSGYPTFGLGLNLPLLKIEYAYWTDELGRYAGQNPESNHQVTLALRFGQNGGRAWGRAAAPASTGKVTSAKEKTVSPETTRQAEPAPETPAGTGTREKTAQPAPAVPADGEPSSGSVTDQQPSQQPDASSK